MNPALPILIAHRGASGYLPEHTLEAKALAHAMGADFIEQDVVLTNEGVPIILHDIYLDATTDVAGKFPGRERNDGRFYALDFSLEEIKSLRVHERSQRDSQGQEVAVYAQRFPLGLGHFQIPTLREEIDMITGLNRSRGLQTGLYIELKAPRWHGEEGHDIAAAVIAILEQTSYDKRRKQVYLQCFDNSTLIRLRQEFATELPLIQLIADPCWGEDSDADFDFLRTPTGLAQVAQYADGIGPWIPHVIESRSDGRLASTGLSLEARKQGLLVHPYTLRQEELPPGVEHLDDLHRALFDTAGVDGVFSDFPDLTRRYLDQQTAD